MTSASSKARAVFDPPPPPGPHWYTAAPPGLPRALGRGPGRSVCGSRIRITVVAPAPEQSATSHETPSRTPLGYGGPTKSSYFFGGGTRPKTPPTSAHSERRREGGHSLSPGPQTTHITCPYDLHAVHVRCHFGLMGCAQVPGGGAHMRRGHNGSVACVCLTVLHLHASARCSCECCHVVSPSPHLDRPTCIQQTCH